MNRRLVLFGNLVLLVGFIAGYAAAFFTVKKVDKLAKTASPLTITQTTGPADPSSAKDVQPAAPTQGDTPAAVSSLQAQLAEKTAKVAELQQKLNAPAHDAVAPEEDTPEFREKLAAELMETTRTKEMIQQSFKASAQIMGKDLTPEGQEALSQSMQKIYAWDKMEKMFSKVYTDVFTSQELNDMAEFYRSDVGANMLKKQPEVMNKTIALVQQINQEAQPKLIAELEAIAKKHHIKTATSTKPDAAPVKN